MKVRQLSVRNFRGIASLDWIISSEIVCLVGPGDSGKTTILDALEIALLPRWNLSISDADFFNGDSSAEMTIEVTVTELPTTVIDTFELDLRGWDGVSVVDEPFTSDGDLQPALTIRFSCGKSLDPTWMVVNDRNAEGRPCSSRDRERLGLVRLDDTATRHLTWTRGSGLTRVLSGNDDVGVVIADAERTARSAVDGADLDYLDDHLIQISERSSLLGARHETELRIALDTSAAGLRTSGLSLHGGRTPLSRSGLGSRRLSVTAIHSLSVADGAIMLIDEVEHGLEPHRVRHFIRAMSDTLQGSDSEAHLGDEPGSGQVFFTTHSPVAVQEVSADSIFLTRWSEDGALQVVAVSDVFQNLLRAHPGAVLSRRVVVCEGKTELGICWGLEGFLTGEYLSGRPPAHRGIEFIDGGGSSAAGYAAQLCELGLEVAVFADGDRPMSPSVEELRERGVTVFLWEDGLCTEQRLAGDLPWEGVVEMVRLAQESFSPADIARRVAREIGGDGGLDDDPASWNEVFTEDTLRSAIGTAAKESIKENGAKRGGWFKLVEPGTGLAAIIVDHWDGLAEPTRRLIHELGEWTNADLA